MSKTDKGKINAKAPSDEKYVLHLYVTGATPNSTRAISNIRAICRDRLKGRVSLEITDVYVNKDAAVREQLIALPMLVKHSPGPLRKLVGDLSNTEKVLMALGLNEPL